jgi:hypothetical protein
MRNAYKCLVGEPVRKTSLERHKILGSHSGEYEDWSLLGVAPCRLIEVDQCFKE